MRRSSRIITARYEISARPIEIYKRAATFRSKSKYYNSAVLCAGVRRTACHFFILPVPRRWTETVQQILVVPQDNQELRATVTDTREVCPPRLGWKIPSYSWCGRELSNQPNRGPSRISDAVGLHHQSSGHQPRRSHHVSPALSPEICRDSPGLSLGQRIPVSSVNQGQGCPEDIPRSLHGLAEGTTGTGGQILVMARQVVCI